MKILSLKSEGWLRWKETAGERSSGREKNENERESTFIIMDGFADAFF